MSVCRRSSTYSVSSYLFQDALNENVDNIKDGRDAHTRDPPWAEGIDRWLETQSIVLWTTTAHNCVFRRCNLWQNYSFPACWAGALTCQKLHVNVDMTDNVSCTGSCSSSRRATLFQVLCLFQNLLLFSDRYQQLLQVFLTFLSRPKIAITLGSYDCRKAIKYPKDDICDVYVAFSMPQWIILHLTWA